MSIIKSSINPRSPEFQANAEAMGKVVADLREKAAQVSLGGGESARAKHTARGKLLPRDRVDHLLDPGTGFLEVGQLAALGMYDNEAPSAGVITGIQEAVLRNQAPNWQVLAPGALLVAVLLPLAIVLRGTRWYRQAVVGGGSVAIAGLALVWTLQRSLES